MKNKLKQLDFKRIVKKAINESKQSLREIAACKDEGGSCTIPNPWQNKKGCFKTGKYHCYCSSNPGHCAGSTGSVRGGVGGYDLDYTLQAKNTLDSYDKNSEELMEIGVCKVHGDCPMGMTCGPLNNKGYGTCGGGNSWDTGKTKGVKSTSNNTGGDDGEVKASRTRLSEQNNTQLYQAAASGDAQALCQLCKLTYWTSSERNKYCRCSTCTCSTGQIDNNLLCTLCNMQYWNTSDRNKHCRCSTCVCRQRPGVPTTTNLGVDKDFRGPSEFDSGGAQSHELNPGAITPYSKVDGVLQEEINRNRELMGTINESQLLLERPLTGRQRSGFGNCAMFGGSFWCANGADECAKILESGDDGACTGSVTPGTTDIKLDLDKDLQARTAGPEPTDKRDVELGINEELLVEGKKFWRQLEACREEIATGGGEDGENEYGGGKHCRKFRRNYM